MELVIVTPPVAASALDLGLVELTKAIVATGVTNVGGGLGGQFGYGALWDDDVFSMHPYCWCEQDDCPWCLPCLCPEDAVRHFLADGTEVSGEEFYAAGGYRTGRTQDVPDKQCTKCRNNLQAAPNFHHKATGLEVRWYKWIGRGTDVTNPVDEPTWEQILRECLSTVSRTSQP